MSAASNVWAPLLPVAMVGSERHAAALPTWPGEVGAVLVQAISAAPEPATAVLRACAVLAACAQAGARGADWDAELPPACPPEPLPEPQNASLCAQMAWAWQEGPARLQHELCALLASQGQRLPVQHLPDALEQGRRSIALRGPLLPVLGTRGLWLAALREDWRYAAGVQAEAADAEARWTEGTAEQRLAFLARERAQDPAAARERLRLALPELGAKERAELLGVLALKISEADANMLDRMRTDRSREVRQVALSLLLRLPGAAHPSRAAERMALLVRHERALLLKRWVQHAPEAVAEDWKADNIEAARPQHESLGERAWWLYQLVRQLRLSWWQQHTGMKPQDLLQWAAGTDWAEALLRGWRDVLFAAPDSPEALDWCRALLNAWPEKHLRDERSAVLALLPLAEREQHWQRQLASTNLGLSTLLSHVLAALPAGAQLSPEFSQALASKLLQRPQQTPDAALRDDYLLRSLLPDLCCVLHPSALDALAQRLQLAGAGAETASLANTLHSAMQVINTRRALHKHLSQETHA
ncbi:hypothetical protein DBR47_15650 [Paucibacter sp. KBW04]|uniref:DUF5691 domain-containing protein n=1 Tax=Paucibacter sp. KBW04 TaxID=2153361 RepID=UPI000F562A81|nr:DUF5691 domain-containing protein [Paucibacter sp. KBW04]RQO57264.1 hypothetical protein DBR47_15650 [Paucibacter sp. KBW04]